MKSQLKHRVISAIQRVNAEYNGNLDAMPKFKETERACRRNLKNEEKIPGQSGERLNRTKRST